jgi:glycerophosphoryl diester phosphodiesterase
MAWFAQHAPHIPRIQLASGFKSWRMSLLFKEALKLFMFNRLSKPHFIGYHAAALPNKSVSHQRSQGRPVLGWTVRSQEEYERLEGICDNIIFEGFIPQPPPGAHHPQISADI